MVPRLRPGKLELTLMVCSLAALHAFDVYLTLLHGGLAIEANPFMVFLWTRCGLIGPLVVKLVSLGCSSLAGGLLVSCNGVGYSASSKAQVALGLCY